MKIPFVKVSFVILFSLLLSCSFSWAGFIDFEDGADGAVISSTIEGMEFTTTNGYDWVYGDWRTGEYNGPYPNDPNGTGYSLYYSDGNFFAWLGTDQGTGIITFTEAYATFFEIGYSAHTSCYLEAYDANDNLLDSVSGPGNLDTGQMDYLRVTAPGMAYVKVHDTGNFWLIDNLYTDAILQCREDGHCQDGNFCTGEKYCDPITERCKISGNPCGEGYACNEETDSCDEEAEPDDDDIPADDDDDSAADDDDAPNADDDAGSDDDGGSDDDVADNGEDDDSADSGCCG